MKDRLKLICDLIEKFLPCSYERQLKVFEMLIYKPWPFEEGMFAYGYHLYPISEFVERHAEQNLQASIQFIEKLTQRFTGEWAIRTVANADQSLTMKAIRLWSTDKNFHVRRLASEGVRPRLPWGKNIDWINADPKKIIPIYNRLRNDPSLYVRRSVANAMADIIKLDQKLSLDTFEKWLSQKKTPENLWVISHAIRKPRKEKVTAFLKLDKTVKELRNQP